MPTTYTIIDGTASSGPLSYQEVFDKAAAGALKHGMRIMEIDKGRLVRTCEAQELFRLKDTHAEKRYEMPSTLAQEATPPKVAEHVGEAAAASVSNQLSLNARKRWANVLWISAALFLVTIIVGHFDDFKLARLANTTLTYGDYLSYFGFARVVARGFGVGLGQLFLLLVVGSAVAFVWSLIYFALKKKGPSLRDFAFVSVASAGLVLIVISSASAACSDHRTEKERADAQREHNWNENLKIGKRSLASAGQWTQEHARSVEMTIHSLFWTNLFGVYTVPALDVSLRNQTGKKLTAVIIEIVVANRKTGAVALREKGLLQATFFNGTDMRCAVFNAEPLTSWSSNSEIPKAVKALGENADWSFSIQTLVPDGYWEGDLIAAADLTTVWREQI